MKMLDGNLAYIDLIDLFVNCVLRLHEVLWIASGHEIHSLKQRRPFSIS